MLFIGNAFSLQMISTGNTIYTQSLSIDEVSEILGNYSFVSCVGHADTANVLSSIIGIQIPMNRMSVKLSNSDTLIVAQIQGGRLPEGSTTLPNGVVIEFIKVTIN